MFSDEILNSIDEIIKDHRVFLVGGYLRNFYLKKEISLDRDLVTVDDSYSLASKIAQKTDATLIELDSDNKIYRVVLKDKKNYFDISQALNNNILDDAKRRDFTINSVFYDLNKKEIFDPLEGIQDIQNKIIKTTDLNNLKDDPLRLLRLYRFKSKTGFLIDEKLNDFVKTNFSLIEQVALERVNYEILEIFKGEFLVDTLLKMFEDGVLELVFPFIKEIKRVPPNSHHHLDLVHHSIETVNQIKSDKPLLKLAAFYHDIGKPSTWTIEPKGRHRFIGHDLKGGEIVKKELEKLKFSNKQINYISKMVKYHIYPASLVQCEDSKKAFARFVRKLGVDTPDIIELSRADRLSALGVDVTQDMVNRALNHLQNLLNYYREVSAKVQNPKSLLDGKEIMETLNLKPCKKVGEIIEQLIEAQLTGEVQTKQQALDFVLRFKD